MSRFIHMTNKKRVIALSLMAIILMVTLTVTLITVLPASAAEREAEKVKTKVEKEFKGLDRVEFSDEITNTQNKKYWVYDLKNDKGDEIGFVHVDAASLEICTIFYGDKKRIPDNDIDVEKAKKAATDYLDSKGKALGKEYVLTRAEKHCDWTDGLNRQFSVYQLEWSKHIGEVRLPDSVYMEVDAGSGEVLFWSKHESGLTADIDEGKLKPEITKNDAIKIVESAIASPTKWAEESKATCGYALETEMKVNHNITLRLSTENGADYKLIWDIEIIYEEKVKKASPNDYGIKEGYLIDGTSYWAKVDAISGEIIYLSESL